MGSSDRSSAALTAGGRVDTGRNSIAAAVSAAQLQGQSLSVAIASTDALGNTVVRTPEHSGLMTQNHSILSQNLDDSMDNDDSPVVSYKTVS